MRRRGRGYAAVRCLLLLWGALALAGWTAHAAGVAAPFFDQPDLLRYAFGTESAAVRLTAAWIAAGEDAADEAAALLQDARETYLHLFAASLDGRDPDLARRLAASLEEAEAAAGRGDGGALTGALKEARALVAEARGVLVPREALGDPALAGALAFTLLLWEGGVAEGFEEAVEEGDREAYLIGRAALQHVDSLWQQVLRPAIPAEETGELDGLLDRLKGLFAVLEPRDSLGYDPEEGETWAQVLVGSLERLIGAELYPDRDPGRLVVFLHAQTHQACTSPDAAGSGPDRERLRWAGILYEEHLESVAGLFLPETARTVEDELEALAGASGTAGSDCSALLGGLQEMAAFFGG